MKCCRKKPSKKLTQKETNQISTDTFISYIGWTFAGVTAINLLSGWSEKASKEMTNLYAFIISASLSSIGAYYKYQRLKSDLITRNEDKQFLNDVLTAVKTTIQDSKDVKTPTSENKTITLESMKPKADPVRKKLTQLERKIEKKLTGKPVPSKKIKPKKITPLKNSSTSAASTFTSTVTSTAEIKDVKDQKLEIKIDELKVAQDNINAMEAEKKLAEAEAKLVEAEKAQLVSTAKLESAKLLTEIKQLNQKTLASKKAMAMIEAKLKKLAQESAKANVEAEKAAKLHLEAKAKLEAQTLPSVTENKTMTNPRKSLAIVPSPTLQHVTKTEANSETSERKDRTQTTSAKSTTTAVVVNAEKPKTSANGLFAQPKSKAATKVTNKVIGNRSSL